MAFSAVITILMIIITTLISTSNAEIRFTQIRSDSHRIIPLDEFGFTHNGRLDLNVSNLSFSSPLTTDDPDLSKVGFIIFKRDLWLLNSQDMEHNEIACALDLNNTKQVYTLSSLPEGATSFNRSYIQSQSYQYAFVFVNCLPRKVRVRVSMDVRSAMYNLHEESNTHDYLSVGMTILPPVYIFLSLIYFTMAIHCVYVLYKKRLNVFGVHFLMLGVVILKALQLLCEAVEKSYIKQTGSAHGWDIRFYIFSFLNGITSFTLLLLVGSGWSVKKRYLYDKERWILMVGIPLQVVSNILQVLMVVIPLQICATAGFILVDFINFCLVLIKFTNSLHNLDEATKIGGKEDITLTNLKNFRRYTNMIFWYYYFTRLVVGLLEVVVIPYKYMGTTTIVVEIINLAAYVFTGYSFKPEALNPYPPLDNDDDMEAEIKSSSKSTYGSF